MYRLGGDQTEEPDIYSPGFIVVVVLVEAGESEDQAWQRHLKQNPKDSMADIKVFHFVRQ